MRKLADALHPVAVTLWVGALWAIGGIAAPALFEGLPGMLAGALAGRLFTLTAYVGIGCGLYLLLFRFARFRLRAFGQLFFWIVLVMLLLTLAGHFGIQPILEHLKEQALPQDVMRSVLRNRFSAWHGVSGTLYLIQSALGLTLVLLQRRVPH
ncbi:MAG TPA: DUF4149 domain-containing protein [Burkholderiales bacterium]|nr:DUF4149 domain-containing protein [Burkholderiales bacterium]